MLDKHDVVLIERLGPDGYIKLLSAIRHRKRAAVLDQINGAIPGSPLEHTTEAGGAITTHYVLM